MERSLNDHVGGPGTRAVRPPAGPGPKSPISIPPIMRHDSRLSPGRDSGPISRNLEIGDSEGIPDFNLKVPSQVRPESPGKQRAPVSRFRVGRFDFKRLQVPSYGVVCHCAVPARFRRTSAARPGIDIEVVLSPNVLTSSSCCGGGGPPGYPHLGIPVIWP